MEWILFAFIYSRLTAQSTVKWERGEKKKKRKIEKGKKREISHTDNPS